MKSSVKFLIVFLSVLGSLSFLTSCEDALPKPKAMLRLEYKKPVYEAYQFEDCPYAFDRNLSAEVIDEHQCSINLKYPEMNGTIYLSYRNVHDDLKELLSDVQKMTYEHVVKADNIVEQPYSDKEARKYGMFYEVTGNAASQSQFYITDSTQHFITGSIYFNTRPNYDSILPAAAYLKEDVRRIMESLQWR